MMTCLEISQIIGNLSPHDNNTMVSEHSPIILTILSDKWKISKFELHRLPAEAALEILLSLKCDSVPSKDGIKNLSKDASLVPQASQALRSSRDQDRMILDRPALSAVAKSLADSLDDLTLLKLALLTLHFTLRGLRGQSPESLRRFLTEPNEDSV